MRTHLVQSIAGVLGLSITMLGGVPAGATDYFWDNDAADNNFTNPVNWVGDMLPASSARDALFVDLDGVNKAVLSSGELFNFASLHVGHSSGSGEFEQTGGTLRVTQHPNNSSLVGLNGNTGTWTMVSGSAQVNTIKIANSAGSAGSLILNGGSMTVSRAAQNYSLHVGATGTGTGTVEVSGGSLITRAGVFIGSNSTFSVVGAEAAQIGIGTSGALDGRWIQDVGGTLKVQIATNGVTPILVDYVDGTGGGGAWLGMATFAPNAELDVSFLGGHVETNVWLVMEAEGGITDNGLKLADSVDTNDWGLILTDDELYVSYGGATLPEPVTNLFVEAAVPMAAETWNLWAPDPRNSSALSDQSSSGFTALFDMVNTDPPFGYYPVVAQEFANDLDISEVGQGVTISFDVELLTRIGTTATSVLDTDFRFSFYDTNQNCQITSVMIDMGPPAGSTMRMRILDLISGSDTNQFVPGDYALLGLGYTTLAGASGYPGNGLRFTGEVYRIESSIIRTDVDEISVMSTWSDTGTTVNCSMVINESIPPDDMPASGVWDTVSGCGFMMFDEQPFWPASEGSFRISNFEVTQSAKLPQGFSYGVSSITLEPSGDVTLTLLEPVIGATYTVQTTADILVPMNPVGTYVAAAPGIITIPAADIAPYTDEGFMGVDLPVIAVTQ